MTPSKLILLTALICISNSSAISTADTPRKLMLNPPAIPFDTQWFTIGLAQGFITPVLGIHASLASEPRLLRLLSEYNTFKANPTAAAQSLYAHRFLPNDPNLVTTTNAYIDLRQFMKSHNNQNEIRATIETLDKRLQDNPSNICYDGLCDEHNRRLNYYQRHISECSGILIGSIISTTAAIYVILLKASAVSDKLHATSRTTCTRTCREDLD